MSYRKKPKVILVYPHFLIQEGTGYFPKIHGD